jgi:hypothetical protein
MNQLEVIFFQGKPAPAPVRDKRYRVLVTLMRSDRPRFWTFLCMNCGSKIAELQNYEVTGVDDFYDPQNINNAGIGRHCKGTQPSDGLPCQYSYFFNVQ